MTTRIVIAAKIVPVVISSALALWVDSVIFNPTANHLLDEHRTAFRETLSHVEKRLRQASFRVVEEHPIVMIATSILPRIVRRVIRYAAAGLAFRRSSVIRGSRRANNNDGQCIKR